MGCNESTQANGPVSFGGVGNAAARSAEKKGRRATRLAEFHAIPDQYQTLDQVIMEIRKAGLESSQLIIGVDFTKSNLWTGQQSFSGKSLHDCFTGGPNPYQECIDVIGRTLEQFDDDRLIPAYGFGDNFSRDRAVLPFKKGPAGKPRPCQGVEEVLQRYEKIAKKVILAGPTSFAPLIYEAIRLVQLERQYHILVIIADGKVDSRKEETVKAIVDATQHPLSIIMVGVGDGPWETMEEFDDELPERQFDNFQFVEFNEIKEIAGATSGPKFESSFALSALMEIPDQYKIINQLGLLANCAADTGQAAFPAFDSEDEDEDDAFDAMDDEDDEPTSPKSPKSQQEYDANALDEEPPELYLCPITHELMKDPVVCGDGFTYERAAIEAWLRNKKHPVSPMTGEPVDPKAIIPNHSLKSDIISWMEMHM